MKKALLISIASFVLVVSCKTASQNNSAVDAASAVNSGKMNIACSSKEVKATLTGSVGKDGMSLTINGDSEELGIYQGSDLSKLDFVLMTRKKEETYSFKFYLHEETNQDYHFSMPKNISSDQKSFVAYFNVATDDGDFMVPGSAMKFVCKIK